MSKLPNELQIIISRKFDKNSWKFSSLLESFKTELEARERCNVVNSTAEGNTGKQDARPIVTLINSRLRRLWLRGVK